MHLIEREGKCQLCVKMAASCRVGWSDQTCWQRDRVQADRQRDRQAGRETDGQTDKQTGIHACRQRNRHVDK